LRTVPRGRVRASSRYRMGAPRKRARALRSRNCGLPHCIDWRPRSPTSTPRSSLGTSFGITSSNCRLGRAAAAMPGTLSTAAGAYRCAGSARRARPDRLGLRRPAVATSQQRRTAKLAIGYETRSTTEIMAPEPATSTTAAPLVSAGRAARSDRRRIRVHLLSSPRTTMARFGSAQVARSARAERTAPSGHTTLRSARTRQLLQRGRFLHAPRRRRRVVWYREHFARWWSNWRRFGRSTIGRRATEKGTA